MGTGHLHPFREILRDFWPRFGLLVIDFLLLQGHEFLFARRVVSGFRIRGRSLPHSNAKFKDGIDHQAEAQVPHQTTRSRWVRITWSIGLRCPGNMGLFPPSTGCYDGTPCIHRWDRVGHPNARWPRHFSSDAVPLYKKCSLDTAVNLFWEVLWGQKSKKLAPCTNAVMWKLVRLKLAPFVAW